ncbi:hypothetical protein G5T42_07710 [Microbacterium sp. 4R-513]|nr:hypothetical protein G5T42_07710 [Microbacterium sp. 4R-513]
MAEGYSEWRVVRQATKRFEDHQQPVAPLWGFTNDCDVHAAHRSARLAAAAGVSAFIVDWYRGERAPFQDRQLDEVIARPGFPLPFSLMWGNHHLVDVCPAPANEIPPPSGLRDGRPIRLQPPHRTRPEPIHVSEPLLAR